MNRRRKQEKSISGWNIPEREGNLGRHWTEQLVSKRHITYLTASHVTYGRYPINTQNVGLFKPAKFSPFKNYFHVSFLLIFTIVPRCCCKKHLFQSTQLLCDEGRIQINISWLLSLLGRPYSPPEFNFQSSSPILILPLLCRNTENIRRQYAYELDASLTFM